MELQFLATPAISNMFTVNRQISYNLTVNRQNAIILTVNHQRQPPPPIEILILFGI